MSRSEFRLCSPGRNSSCTDSENGFRSILLATSDRVRQGVMVQWEFADGTIYMQHLSLDSQVNVQVNFKEVND